MNQELYRFKFLFGNIDKKRLWSIKMLNSHFLRTQKHLSLDSYNNRFII